MEASNWLAGGGNGHAVDVPELFGDADLTKAIAELIQLGPLVSFGTTSDGGALGITVTVDGDWRREYVRSIAELSLWIAEALPGVEALLSAPRPSAAPRGRPRRASTR